MSSPSSSMAPSTRAEATVSFMRFMQRRNVDLPQPDGPMNAVTFSRLTSIETSLICLLLAIEDVDVARGDLGRRVGHGVAVVAGHDWDGRIHG